MGKLAELAAQLPPAPPPRCKYQRLYEGLDADDRAVVEEWIAKRSIDRLAVLLRDAGLPIGAGSIRRHLSGRCGCGRAA